MARPVRPASESFQPVCYSGSQPVSFSSEAVIAGLEDEDDRTPIFSLSKSSMDVVMATGQLHKWDPVLVKTNLKRSSSTNTHSEQNSVMLQQLHPHMWQHINANSHQLSLTASNMDAHSPPALSERWITNMQRWSGCSGSTRSRSSTPETVVWKDGTSRPSSLSQETTFSTAPDSPMSKTTTPPTTPSPLVSPLHTPTLPPVDLLTSSYSSSSLRTQKVLLVSSPTRSPLQSPLPTPLQGLSSSHLSSNSPDLHHLTSTEEEVFLQNNLLSFTFPSPNQSSVSIVGGGVSSDPGCLADDEVEELQSPGGTLLPEAGDVMTHVQMSNYLTPNSLAEGQESGRGASVCHLELPRQPGQSCLTGRGWRTPLVSSLSDSQLGDCCRCNFNTRAGIKKVEMFRERGTMTSQLELVDAAVQTVSPAGSLWGLGISTSNMDSHSVLGSPPGSRLNLKSSLGSNSNLVSPSSSMFLASSAGEEERQGDDPPWDSASSDLERRRSCLKIQGEERVKMGRRGSMKQVQWDEDGMTWDVHGASVDPEVLTSAIQKHLELQSSPRPAKRISKKKKAPKPPIISSVIKAMAPELNPPEMIITSTCMVEDESEGTPEADTGREVEEEGGAKREEETVEAICRKSRAEGDNAKEEEEVYREEGTSHPKSPSQGSGHCRKKSVIRSLRRPGWCGGSRKAAD
ncbi:uncharacterized protein LOC123982447 isoform X2 [Micropterus dolomieu]|nr:uncharacterized protein LOC123982447 isoform X2 [Micropterus dolomieu]XP_045923923.1 uncharacterized protein LOC123982447 isoform X2 [Micropterus dolomieu]